MLIDYCPGWLQGLFTLVPPFLWYFKLGVILSLWDKSICSLLSSICLIPVLVGMHHRAGLLSAYGTIIVFVCGKSEHMNSLCGFLVNCPHACIYTRFWCISITFLYIILIWPFFWVALMFYTPSLSDNSMRSLNFRQHAIDSRVLCNVSDWELRF